MGPGCALLCSATKEKRDREDQRPCLPHIPFQMWALGSKERADISSVLQFLCWKALNCLAFWPHRLHTKIGRVTPNSEPWGGDSVRFLPSGFVSNLSPLPWRETRAGWHLSEHIGLPFTVTISVPFWRQSPGPRVRLFVQDYMPILTMDGEEVSKQEAQCWKMLLHKSGPLCTKYLDSDRVSISVWIKCLRITQLPFKTWENRCWWDMWVKSVLIHVFCIW